MTLLLRKPPTVRLDGEKVRLLRESKGLTQLYVAEVARVSVDTVSRWENNRTPAVKRENAQALADALEVDLDSILQEEPAAPEGASAAPAAPEAQEEGEGRPRPRLWPWVGGVAVLVLLGLWTLWRAAGPAPFVVEGQRRLPLYTPPGTEVPVVVHLRAVSGVGQRVILRETLPPGWALLGAEPSPDQGPAPDGTIKWILTLEDGGGRVAYLVRAPPGGTEGSAHRFFGEVVTPGADDGSSAVRGEGRIDLEFVHWADHNADFQISDAEVLDALERLEGAHGLGLDPADLRALWGARDYEWDRTRGGFRPLE
ncbi:MAG: helix-turn-helix domain-containing protein [Thermodesulfobacteriota bacterium]|jgi:transcriptional regulator with XRE-family HTH domain